MEEIAEISSIIQLGLLGFLGLSLIIGMLFGLGRGLKRSALRLGIFGGTLLIFFFLTPLISRGLLNITIPGVGKSAVELVQSLVQEAQESSPLVGVIAESLGDYATSFAVALLNIFVFLILYFIIKIVTWIIYAIVAHFVAPKRDKERNKIKKHAWWGCLVGLAQSLILFFFLMLPVNGLLGIVAEAGRYKPLDGIYETTSDGTSKANALTTLDALNSATSGTTISQNNNNNKNNNNNNGNNSDFSLTETFKDLSDGMAVYNGILRYTGMEALTGWAFGYQTTVRVTDAPSINIREDIVKGLNLASDITELGVHLNNIQTNDNDNVFAVPMQMTNQDYQAVKLVIKNVADLDLVNSLGDSLLSKLDAIMSASNDPKSTKKLVGTEIYEDSIYGSITSSMASEANYAKMATGLQAIIKALSDQKFSQIRDDILATVDLVQGMCTIKIKYGDKEEPVVVITALTDQHDDATEFLAILLAQFKDTNDAEKLTALHCNQDDGVLDLFLNYFTNLNLQRVLAAKDAENILKYNNAFDELGDDANGKLVRDFIGEFLGTPSIDHVDEKTGKLIDGTWTKIKNLTHNVFGVVRDFTQDATVKQQFTKIINGQMDGDENVMQPILDAMCKKVDNSKKGDEKYKSVDDLTSAFYHLVFDFDPLHTFILNQVEQMEDNEGKTTLMNLLKTEDEQKWKDIMRGLINVTLLTNEDSALNKLLHFDTSNPEQALGNILGTLVNDETLNKETVTDTIYAALLVTELGGEDSLIPNVGSQLKEMVNTNLDDTTVAQLNTYFEDYKVGEDGKGAGEVIKEQLEGIADFMQNFKSDATDANGEVIDQKEALQEKVDALYDIVGNSLSEEQRNQILQNILQGRTE